MNCAFTAPHSGAAKIGQNLLEQGASAVDAMVAAAAAISVLYPHMNSLAGDGFWIIDRPGEQPIAIDACGWSASAADIDWYKLQGLHKIPNRGGASALTLGGTLAGWQLARQIDSSNGYQSRELIDLLKPAIELANKGIEVSKSLETASNKVDLELANLRSYREVFCHQGRPLKAGENFANPELGIFMQRLASEGIDDFYRGSLAEEISQYLGSMGSPLRLTDFQHYRAKQVKPLQLETSLGDFFNLPAPTQGIASLLILAIYDEIVSKHKSPLSEAEHIHYLVEATKQAFIIRDREVTDPNRLSDEWTRLLSAESIQSCIANIDGSKASPWPKPAEPGDTVWMGAVDSQGCMVSFIQSIYWEFGSGVVIPGLGLVWNNRGISFSLDKNHVNHLEPLHKPFHTLNPAFAKLKDGRRISYGTMGGEGQPQTQAAIMARYLYQGYPLEEAISRGRWLLGRTWGEENNDLKLEADLYQLVGQQLEMAQHAISQVPSCNELMGHAGAIVMQPDGSIAASSDPRSDGRAFIGSF